MPINAITSVTLAHLSTVLRNEVGEVLGLAQKQCWDSLPYEEYPYPWKMVYHPFGVCSKADADDWTSQ